MTLERDDPEVATLIASERQREERTIDLIASENLTPSSIMEARGSIFTNKYAEGYPGRRYYGGCQSVDRIETLAIKRCKRLFSAEHANVQPHSGTQANMAVYFAALNQGDTIMGMSLDAGRPLEPRRESKLLGSLVPRRLLWRGSHDGDDRLRGRAAASSRDQAEDDRGRRLLVSSSSGLRDLSGNRR